MEQQDEQTEIIVKNLERRYALGIASPMEALMLVRHRAPKKAIRFFRDARLKIYNSLEVMNYCMDQVDLTNKCAGRKIGEWVVLADAVEEDQFMVVGKNRGGVIFSLKKSEVEALDMKRLRPLVDGTLSTEAPTMEISDAA